MKQSSIIQVAVFYLILLLSNEGITVATNIRQTVGLRKNIQLSSSLNNMVNMMENLDVDSFLEVEDMHGMSAEAYGTLEMIEMHKSLKEGFSFEHSPILKDLNSLKEIPENKILSASELKQHREDVSILLEKAMSSIGSSIDMTRSGIHKKIQGPSNVLQPKNEQETCTVLDSIELPTGKCNRGSFWSSCDEHSECTPDEHDPCKGECVCGTDGVNACMCVSSRADFEAKKADTGRVLENEKKIESALTVKNVGTAVLFGFIDGFLGGMATDLNEAWKDEKCQDRSDISDKFKDILRKAKSFWHTMKKLPKGVWKQEGRKRFSVALKEFALSIASALKALWKYTMECPALKMLSTILLVILGMVLLMAVLAAITVVGVFLKIAGGLVGLYFSFNYMKKTVQDIWKLMINGRGNSACKILLIEKSANMVGAITEVVVLGGVGDFLSVSKNPKAASLLTKYNLDFSSSFMSDIRKLAKAAKNAKKGMKTPIKTLNNMLTDSIKVIDDAVTSAKKGRKVVDGAADMRKVDWKLSKDTKNRNIVNNNIHNAEDALKKFDRKHPRIKKTDVETWNNRNTLLQDINKAKIKKLEFKIKTNEKFKLNPEFKKTKNKHVLDSLDDASLKDQETIKAYKRLNENLEKVKTNNKNGKFDKKLSQQNKKIEDKVLQLENQAGAKDLDAIEKAIGAIENKETIKTLKKIRNEKIHHVRKNGKGYLKDAKGRQKTTMKKLESCGTKKYCKTLRKRLDSIEAEIDVYKQWTLTAKADDAVDVIKADDAINEKSKRNLEAKKIWNLFKKLEGTKYTVDDRRAQKNGRTSFFNWIRESVSAVFKPKAKCWKKGEDRTKTFKCKSELAKLGLKEYILTKTSNTGNDQRRRLLSKVRMDWDDAWSTFISNVKSHGDNDGKCKVHNSLSGVNVDADGSYSFSCSQSPDLCDCISQVGSTNADTQYFVNQNMGIYLGVFKDGGTAAYEICEINGECHAYGDVNDGMNARRRRLLGRRGGGC